MSVNRYFPHIFILPEDDANRQLATGFLLHPEVRTAQIQILQEAGGWTKVRSCFISDHAAGMQAYPERSIIFLVDFDQEENRIHDVQENIPEDLTDRVFVLGAWSDPQGLRRAGLGSFEIIGKAMAEDCHSGTDTIWGHDLLRHNAGELDRLRQTLCSILFPPS